MENNSALIENLQFQFRIAKQLLEYHLDTLEQEEYLWRSPNSGLYIEEITGQWQAEFPETENYSLGTPSVAWTFWHITYWWEMVWNHGFEDAQLTKDDIVVHANVKDVKTQIFH